MDANKASVLRGEIRNCIKLLNGEPSKKDLMNARSKLNFVLSNLQGERVQTIAITPENHEGS